MGAGFETTPPTVNRAYLSLGSNIAPERNLPAAARALTAFGRIAAVSGVWESAPLGSSGANFLNGAVLLETAFSPVELYQQVIVAVERQLGRARDPFDKNAPRTIDVDLSLFNHDVFELAGHRVPDPDIVTRAFVAVPLAELDPEYVHPTDGRRLADIAGSWPSDSGLIARPDVRLRSMS